MPESYRIAIYTRSYPPKGGGIAAAHFSLAQCLRREHEVAIFAFDDDDASQEPNVFRARTPPSLAKVMQWLARRWVRHYATRESAINCERIFRIAPAVRSLNKALQIFGPDFILCPDNFVPALALKKPATAKLIWIAHNNFSRFERNPIATDYSWIDLQLAHRLELRGSRKADAFVAVSEYMMKVGEATLEPSCPKAVVRNYVDSDFLAAIRPSPLRSELGLDPGAALIHIPSGGTAMKGERYTFELIRRLGRNGKVAFFVSGPVGPKLSHELSHATEGPTVHTPGQQPYENNLRDVAACDLTVSPTVIENLSSAFIESLALGVPVVSFDVGGNRELIEDGKNGWLVPYLDVESLIGVSESLIFNAPVLAEMKNAARESIAGLASSERVLNEYGALFSNLSDRGARK